MHRPVNAPQMGIQDWVHHPDPTLLVICCLGQAVFGQQAQPVFKVLGGVAQVGGQLQQRHWLPRVADDQAAVVALGSQTPQAQR